jgi:hypothetical protein
MILIFVDKVALTLALKQVSTLQTVEGAAQTAFRMQYFNAPVGFWEPAIDRFQINLKLFGNGKAFKQVLDSPTPLNVNISVGLARVLANF